MLLNYTEYYFDSGAFMYQLQRMDAPPPLM